MPQTTRHILVALIASLAFSLGSIGCAASGQQVSQQDVELLRERIAELERNHARLRVRIEDGESRLYLLQDRVEANRIALQQSGGLHGGQAGQWNSSPGWGAPPPSAPPRPAHSSPPRAMPDLPVQSVQPEPWAPEPEEGGELVINQDSYNRLFGSSAGGATPSGAAGSSPGQRAPLPPVVPDDVRLSVTDSNAPRAAEERVNTLEIYQGGLQQFNQREYRAALQSMRRVLELGPPPNFEDNAIYWIGESYYGLGEWEAALGYFQTVVRDHARGNKAADAMLKVALTQERLQNTEAAIEMLRLLVQTHPGTNSARRASERLRELE